MADRVNRHGRSAILIDASNHAGISVLMSLQDQVNPVLAHQVVKHPALYQVVTSLDGKEGVMQDEDFPLGTAVFQLLLEPLALCPQVEEFAVAVQHKKLDFAIVQGIDHVIINLGVKEVGEHKGKTALQMA